MMRIVFLGTAAFAVPCLAALHEAGHEIAGVITQPDRPKGRGRQLMSTPIKEAAAALGIEVFQPEKISDQGSLAKIKAWAPDCLIVVAYGQILPKALLTVAPYGCINVHASLLPQYRGGAPIHRAIMDGQEETGVTTMFVAERLDAGDIILQTKRAITGTMSVGELHDLLADDGALLLLETLTLLQQNRAPRRAQVEPEATYAHLLTRADEKIDWRQSAAVIVNLIRGLNPWPGAYTTWAGKNLKIWQGEPYHLSRANQSAGTVTEITEDGLVVTAGDGQGVKILELQLQGKRKMVAAEFQKGNPLPVGTLLGSD